MTQGIVLVGAPGSGKTTVAVALAEAYGFRYLDREASLLERYGSLAAFLENKEGAVVEMQRDARRWMAESHVPWIYESTALTERDFVEELLQGDGYGVRLEVSVQIAVDRVASRPGGHNLSNDPEVTRRIWAACEAAHRSLAFRAKFATDTAPVPDIARDVHRVFSHWTS